MDVQAVAFKKSNWSPSKARKWLQDHNFKPLKQHVTQNFFRYRLKQPDRNKNYHSAYVDDDKTIMFVIESNYSGSGVMDHIQGFVDAWKGTRTNFKPKVREFLEWFGDKKVLGIRVVRRPLGGLYQLVRNGIESLTETHISYDKLFHLFLVFDLDEIDKDILMEKNEDVNMGYYTPQKNEEVIQVSNIPEWLTINKMLSKAIETVGAKRIFHYYAFHTNCQMWVHDMLLSSGLMTPTIKKFVMQKVENIYPHWIEKLSENITDAKNRLNLVVEGHGKTKYD